MNMEDYPHFFLAKDGRLCSMGQNCPGFPRLLYNALIHLGYGGKVPNYRCHLSMVDSLDICETNVMIPLNQQSLGREPSSTASPTPPSSK
jgi:hypothetical protein